MYKAEVRFAKLRWVWLAAIASLLVSLVPLSPVHAQLDTCSIGLSPHSVAPGSSSSFSFGIYNSSSNPITWVYIARPGNLVTVQSGSASAWNAFSDADTVTFVDGSLPNGSSQGFDVQAVADSSPGGPGDWQVYVSDDPSGAGAISCDGDLSLSVATQPSTINISDVQVTNVGPTAVTATWQTDVPATSQVAYGADSTYGQTTATNSTLRTSHSVVVSGLTANTPYHYQVTSTTPSDGGTSTSGDNTFLTAAVQAPIFVSVGSSGGGANVPGVTIKAVPTETIPPEVTVATKFDASFRQAPLISGTARDNEAVAAIEYSLDGGKNWLPADRITPNGPAKSAASVSFSFTPFLSDDGNYLLAVRATDTSRNVRTTPPATLVIDRLPPQLGPLVISYGPEVLTPDEQGMVNILAGSDYKFSASAVGGPTQLVLEAHVDGKAATTTETFALTQSPDSGLWNGVLSFKNGGVYQLVVRGLDGAGNRTSRTVMTVSVTPAGRITSSQSKSALAGARLTLYYLEASSHTWQVWDGAPYSQVNPQRTKSNGSYSLAVPRGTYYLSLDEPKHQRFVSDIFTIDHPTGLASNIELKRLAHLGSGKFEINFPAFDWQSHPLPASNTRTTAKAATGLVGSMLSDFQLPTLAGATKRNLDFEGRPTVITTLATWSPSSQSQLGALAAAQSNRDVNIVPVFSQERAQLVSTYLATAGYQLTGLVDADGVLVPSMQVGSLPQHIFVDRTGRIKKVMVGVFSKDQLLAGLGGL